MSKESYITIRGETGNNDNTITHYHPYHNEVIATKIKPKKDKVQPIKIFTLELKYDKYMIILKVNDLAEMTFDISNYCTSKELHDDIQRGFKWKGYNLHEFKWKYQDSNYI